ncbi:MAG: flagellar assembly protein FliW [Actinomycetota bacterium]
MSGNLTDMQVASSRFGTLDATEDQLITIDGGLLGFPDAIRFVRLPVDDAEGWLWLQSTNDRDLAFLVISAFRFFPDYDIELPDGDVNALELDDPSDAEVLALVTIRHTEDGGIASVTANLLGPLVINHRTGIGRQVVLSDSQHSTREPVAG